MVVEVYHYLQALYITHMGDVLKFFSEGEYPSPGPFQGLDCGLGTVFDLEFLEDVFEVGFSLCLKK